MTDPRWQPLFDALSSPGWIAAISALSLVLLVGSSVVGAWVLLRLPEDYLLTEPVWPRAHGLALLRRIARNVLAALLALAGVAMLVLPGQGLLTLLAACLLLDLPGKRRIEQRLIRIPRVLKAINRLRQRRGRLPLRVGRDLAHGSVTK